MSKFLITIADNGYLVEDVVTNSIAVYEGENISKEMYEDLMMEELTTTLLSLRAQAREKGPFGSPVKIELDIKVDYRAI